MDRTNGLTIGQVAKLANVNIETLRYYERRKILRPEARRESGYRVYGEDAVGLVQFIKRCQKLGFSLDSIQEILSLRPDKKSKCDDVKMRAVKTLKNVNDKISELEGMRRALTQLIRDCEQRKLNEECPMLKDFTRPEKSRRMSGEN